MASIRDYCYEFFSVQVGRTAFTVAMKCRKLGAAGLLALVMPTFNDLPVDVSVVPGSPCQILVEFMGVFLTCRSIYNL